MKLLKSFLNHFLIDTKLRWKHQWEVVILFLIVFIYCISNAIKINPNRGRPYIDFPDWIKNKKPTTNPINKNDNKCFQYTVTVALNH